jgi:para-aminobenzoate synthetase component 1
MADRILREELLASSKDRAENLMIVDLLRNDLSRVCRPGSVRVTSLCEVEQWGTVQHLVSSVRGELNKDDNACTLLAAAFPGGSITGAPKTRAMQIIAEIEGSGRGVYCGSIGWFAADGAAEFSIAIRTLTLTGGFVSLAAGGGIVLDSVAQDEYEETVDKAAALLRVVTEPPIRAGRPAPGSLAARKRGLVA